MGAGGLCWAQAVSGSESLLFSVPCDESQGTRQPLSWEEWGLRRLTFCLLPVSSLMTTSGIEHGPGAGLAKLSALRCLTWTGMGLVSGGSGCLVLRVPLASFSGPKKV